MSDISLLPEDMRGKEVPKEKREKASTPPNEAGGLKMHIPDAEVDEDIEIIEVDEGDLATVLADEPLMTRVTYQLSSAIDKLRTSLFEKKPAPPPPKSPPQFFKPPVSKPGLVTKAPAIPGSRPAGAPSMRPAAPGAPGRPSPAFSGGLGMSAQKTHGERPRARIMPQSDIPRRVRVIRRVRKPVRVSLISSRELAALTVDVTKRKWTLSIVVLLFIGILAFSRFFLATQVAAAEARQREANAELASTRDETAKRLERWKSFEDLQDRLELLTGALKEHVIVTRLFDFLETRTLPMVSYRSASWNAEGQLTLDVTTDSYESAARQLIAFKESESVERAEATSFSISGGRGDEPQMVTFQIVLQLKPEMFRNPVLTPTSPPSSTASGT